MDFILYFCNDGVLRVKWSDKQPLVSLLHIQNSTENADNNLRFLSKWWDKETYFESGLTVKNFIECIKPWKEFWSDYLSIDLASYIEELEKSLNSESCNVKLGEDKWLMLTCEKTLCSEKKSSYSFSSLSNMTLTEKIKIINENRVLSGNYNLDGKTKLNGYYYKEKSARNLYINKEHFGISSLSLANYAYSKLYLNPYQNIIVMDEEDKNHNLLNENSSGIHKISQNTVHINSDLPDIKYIKINKTYNLREIIEGFFDDFAVNPEVRDQYNQELIKALEDRIEHNEQLSGIETNSLSEEEFWNEMDKEDIEELENIDNSIEQEENKEDNDNSLIDAVSVLKRKDYYWNELVSVAKQTNEILRIGKVETEQPPEQRLYSYSEE